MNFAFNEDQDRLRDSAVRFLRDRIDLIASRARQSARHHVRRIAVERHRRARLDRVDHSGRIRRPRHESRRLGGDHRRTRTRRSRPALTSATTPARSHCCAPVPPNQKEALLPQIVAGSVQTRAGVERNANRPKIRVAATTFVRNGRLTGTKRYVIDADTATHLVVTARDSMRHRWASTSSNAVSRRFDRTRSRGWTSRDASRTVTFDDAAAEPMPVAFRATRGRGSPIGYCWRCRRKTPAAPNRSCARPSRTRISASSSANRSRRIRRSSTNAPT